MDGNIIIAICFGILLLLLLGAYLLYLWKSHRTRKKITNDKRNRILAHERNQNGYEADPERNGSTGSSSWPPPPRYTHYGWVRPKRMSNYVLARIAPDNTLHPVHMTCIRGGGHSGAQERRHSKYQNQQTHQNQKSQDGNRHNKRQNWNNNQKEQRPPQNQKKRTRRTKKQKHNNNNNTADSRGDGANHREKSKSTTGNTKDDNASSWGHQDNVSRWRNQQEDNNDQADDSPKGDQDGRGSKSASQSPNRSTQSRYGPNRTQNRNHDQPPESHWSFQKTDAPASEPKLPAWKGSDTVSLKDPPPPPPSGRGNPSVQSGWEQFNFAW